MSVAGWPYRSLIAVALCIATVGGLAACGGGRTATNGSGGSSASPMAVTIKSFLYSPSNQTVSKGATVSFANQDATPHTATASDMTSFDSGTIEPGKTQTVTFNTPGTFTFYCKFHPFMKGTVIVKP